MTAKCGNCFFYDNCGDCENIGWEEDCDGYTPLEVDFVSLNIDGFIERKREEFIRQWNKYIEENEDNI